jgi:hypothetical protein
MKPELSAPFALSEQEIVFAANGRCGKQHQGGKSKTVITVSYR